MFSGHMGNLADQGRRHLAKMAALALLGAWAICLSPAGVGAQLAPPGCGGRSAPCPTAEMDCVDRDGDRSCSPLERVRSSRGHLAPAFSALGRIHDMLGDDSEFAETQDRLGSATSLLEEALAQLEQGAPCDGAARYEESIEELARAKVALAEAVAAKQSTLIDAASTDADFGEHGSGVALLQLRSRLLERAMEKAIDKGKPVQDVCQEVAGELRARGRIVEIDAAAGTIELDDGSVVGLGESERTGGLAEGRKVRLRGVRFFDGSGLASLARASARAVSYGKLPALPCLRLRVVPVQPLPPAHPGPYTTHPLGGYVSDAGRLELEQGMHLAAESTGVCPATGPLLNKVTRYSMRAEIFVAGHGTLIADALEPGDAPAPLPTLLQTGGAIDSPALVVTTSRRKCQLVATGPDACSVPEVIAIDSYPLRLARLGAYADAVYSDTAFGVVDDDDPGDFEVAQVTQVNVAASLAGTGATFAAEGFRVAGNGTLSLGTVHVGDSFAVNEGDFSPQTSGVDVLFPDMIALNLMQAHGQASRSALRWAHVSGQRSGQPYRYSAKLPRIARDRVAQCGLLPGGIVPEGGFINKPDVGLVHLPPQADYVLQPVKDSFYKLPFMPGVAPGFGYLNIDDPAQIHRHGENQAYAVDLGAPHGTALLAARGGEVVDFESQDPYNIDDAARPPDWDKFGNYVTILHEDGTFGIYYHLVYQGVFVSLGQRVSRGAVIGLVGNTGRSSGPHVHFAVHGEPDADWESVRIRYEALRFDSFEYQLQSCLIPRSNTYIASSNDLPS